MLHVPFNPFKSLQIHSKGRIAELEMKSSLLSLSLLFNNSHKVCSKYQLKYQAQYQGSHHNSSQNVTKLCHYGIYNPFCMFICIIHSECEGKMWKMNFLSRLAKRIFGSSLQPLCLPFSLLPRQTQISAKIISCVIIAFHSINFYYIISSTAGSLASHVLMLWLATIF